MGAAISLFPRAQAVVVPRQRFAPVKTAADLIALRSDAYELTGDYQVRLVKARKMPPVVEVGSDIRFVSDIDRIMPQGVPSLLRCERLRVSGPVTFGRGVRCVGQAEAVGEAPFTVPDGAVLGCSAAT